MRNFAWFILAAACEIGGCYAAWMWLRLGRSPWWLVPGFVSLIVFAVALTRVDAVFAGRAFAAKRHISFAEVASSAILCVPLTLGLPAWVYSTAHLGMIAVQIVGSIWIRKLSPAWETR